MVRLNYAVATYVVYGFCFVLRESEQSVCYKTHANRLCEYDYTHIRIQVLHRLRAQPSGNNTRSTCSNLGAMPKPFSRSNTQCHKVAGRCSTEATKRAPPISLQRWRRVSPVMEVGDEEAARTTHCFHAQPIWLALRWWSGLAMVKQAPHMPSLMSAKPYGRTDGGGGEPL